MEKEKKIIKKESKEKVVKAKEGNRVVFNKEIKRTLKVVSVIASFLAVIVAIFTFVFAIITSLKVANITKAELLHDNFSVTFISNLTNRTINETEDIIQGYGSKALFIIVDIVIPAIATIAICILVIILAKKILDFFDIVTYEKELYNDERLDDIEKIFCAFCLILTITLVVFGQPSIILYVIISSLLFIIIGLFKKCIIKK